MRVLYSGTLNVNAGGPAMSCYNTLIGLVGLGVDAEILMYPFVGKLVGSEIPIHIASAPLEHKLSYSFSYKRELKALGNFDIYHAQGVWQYPTYAVADVARLKGRPYLITPRGMLYPQDIAKSNKLFKEISLRIRLLKDMNRATCIHVTCEEEMMLCRKLGVTAPIAVIPNPVEIKEYKKVKQESIFSIGYLGRLSPRKRVEKLIYALAILNNPDIELLIMGGGDKEYEHFLQQEVQRLNVKNVYFTGFLSGEEKDKALASISILVLPSDFENLGNVILEGLVREIPCIATKGAPWKELEEFSCGWWVDSEQDAITEAITEAMNMSQEELLLKGRRGKILMKDRYSIESVALRMKGLYEYILYKGEKPDYYFD